MPKHGYNTSGDTFLVTVKYKLSTWISKTLAAFFKKLEKIISKTQDLEN